MAEHSNPFEPGTDRHAIWEMSVRRDIEAFVAGDWGAIEADFIAACFYGIDARGRDNPDAWVPGFASLGAYRDVWLTQSAEFVARVVDPAAALFDATILRDIEITGDVALLHKKFDGEAATRGGESIPLHWQTLYQCRRKAGGWRIQGFVGYLPLGTGRSAPAGRAPAKTVPHGAGQHTTAGPYSPVLNVRGENIVVISGQAAILRNGEIPSTDIREQSTLTLQNCRAQLASAGAELDDVFKVNVYLTDLADWPVFNEIYRQVMPDPRPVRTAVGVDLLPGLKVEVEMWAARDPSRVGP